jgi:hypothetical protein
MYNIGTGAATSATASAAAAAAGATAGARLTRCESAPVNSTAVIIDRYLTLEMITRLFKVQCRLQVPAVSIQYFFCGSTRLVAPVICHCVRLLALCAKTPDCMCVFA